MRGTNVHIRTALSAELHPRLRQTARCRLASLFFDTVPLNIPV